MVLEYPVISIGGKEQHRHGECENFDGRKYYKFMSIHTLKHRASHAHTQSLGRSTAVPFTVQPTRHSIVN